MGAELHALGSLHAPRDVFYLSIDEIVAYVEGRGLTHDLASLAALRKAESAVFIASPPLPERFMTYGAHGATMRYPQLVA